MSRPCFNPVQNQRELMAAYERDRDSAASVSEPCYLCSRTATEHCDFCNKDYCEGHMVWHPCALTQHVDGIEARNAEYLRGK